jgi:hypothetical protein
VQKNSKDFAVNDEMVEPIIIQVQAEQSLPIQARDDSWDDDAFSWPEPEPEPEPPDPPFDVVKYMRSLNVDVEVGPSRLPRLIFPDSLPDACRQLIRLFCTKREYVKAILAEFLPELQEAKPASKPRVRSPSRLRRERIREAIDRERCPLQRSEIAQALHMKSEGSLGRDLAWMTSDSCPPEERLVNIPREGYWPASIPWPDPEPMVVYEYRLLGILLALPTLVPVAAEALSPDEIGHTGLRRILEELFFLRAAGLPPDLDSLQGRLLDRPDLLEDARSLRENSDQRYSGNLARAQWLIAILNRFVDLKASK